MQLAVIKQRLGAYVRLTRLHRPIGILLLLWPMLWALWLAAEGVPSTRVLLIFVLGTVLMRSAGCVINDFADRDFDGHVKRTRERPIATGEVGEKEALGLFLALLIPAALLVLMTNRLTLLLAMVAVALAVSYPFAKRHTYLPQLVLGAAFGWAVPMAFAAEINAIPPLAWLVFCAACLWALIYDTQYAMVDRDDDIELGLKSTAILFDDNDRLILGIVMILMLINLLFIGRQAALRWPYYLALVVAGALFAYQQYLISGRERAGCFAAFLNNNWVGGVIFAGIASSYLLSPAE